MFSLMALAPLGTSPGAGAGSLAQDAFDAAFTAQHPSLAARIGAKDEAAYAHQAVRVLAAAIAAASASATAAAATGAFVLATYF